MSLMSCDDCKYCNKKYRVCNLESPAKKVEEGTYCANWEEEELNKDWKHLNISSIYSLIDGCSQSAYFKKRG